MAIKMMTNIVIAARDVITRSEHATPSLLHCAVHHRLGVVPVGEASIVIAVSSPHRKESFVACEYILEQVKLVVPIWKKEIYEEGEPKWKENFVP
jgi:molybdopterin synthase catalytic subunit